MADGKEPMQADGEGAPPPNPDDPPSSDRPDMFSNTGESGGGAYPNPYTDKDKDEAGGFRGGETIPAYYGEGQLGTDKVGETDNAQSEED